jgi:hypothetical protein
VVGGNSGYTFDWFDSTPASLGIIGNIANNLAAGSYSVVATKGICSSLPTLFTIDDLTVLPNSPTVGTITQPTCSVPTGSVNLSGLPAGTWIINPGARAGSGTTTSITGLNPGPYNFTVTDASTGCTSTAANVVIDPLPNAPTVTGGTITDANQGQSNGSIDATGTVTGGSGSYTYEWHSTSTPNSGNLITSGPNSILLSLATGSYSLIVIDNTTGCLSVPSIYTVNEKLPPTVLSVNLQAPANATTNASSVTFRVTFSVAVVSVDAADFTKTISGITAGIISVSPVSGTVYDVTVASISGSGSIRLDVLSTASIQDGSGIPYASNFTTGQSYTIDQTPPVFSATAPATNAIVATAQVS